MLYGRERERADLTALVKRARTRRAGVLVVLGEPGVGKSALVEDVISGLPQAPATDAVRVLRTAGVESESPLPFSALHRLLRPVVSLDRLPAPQARAFQVAFGLDDGPPVQPFLVGMATLSALADTANEHGPVLCAVDDAQWLDSASAAALLFAARQLAADPVAMVFTARSTASDAEAFRPSGLPVLELGGLAEEAARQLLSRRRPQLTPGEVADRLVRDSGGNPLALLELPTTLSTDQLSGAAAADLDGGRAAGLPRPQPPSDRGGADVAAGGRGRRHRPGGHRTGGGEHPGCPRRRLAERRALRPADRFRGRRRGPASAGAVGGVPGGRQLRTPPRAPGPRGRAARQ